VAAAAAASTATVVSGDWSRLDDDDDDDVDDSCKVDCRLIGDGTRPYRLPLISGKHADLPSISADTVRFYLLIYRSSVFQEKYSCYDGILSLKYCCQITLQF
jgi:hypothetical protein